MAASLGLTLYAWRRRGPATADAAAVPRPPGRLIWIDVPRADGQRGLMALARRLIDGDGVAVLMTGAPPPPPAPGLWTAAPPPDTPAAVAAFLHHWRPDAVVSGDGELRPLMCDALAERGIPQLVVEARAPVLPRATRWYPGLTRRILSRLRWVLAVDEPAARAFRQGGAVADRVQAAGRLEQPSAALPVNEAERAALARLLGTRPVWLAVALPEAEEAQVIEAHRAVLRLAHRMLLIVVPEDPARAAPLAERMERVEGWAVARRAAEEDLEDEVQVYVADGAELGLWFRLAPTTYLGGSLTTGARCDPMQPAALGSAIVHGPRVGPHGAMVGRLAAAQATVLVATAADLAEAVAELTAPDRAARLAQAAWGVTTDGAEVTDRVLALIRAALPAPEAGA